jgi:hypothetical protein
MNGQIFGWNHWTGTALTLSDEVERAEVSNVKGTALTTSMTTSMKTRRRRPARRTGGRREPERFLTNPGASLSGTSRVRPMPTIRSSPLGARAADCSWRTGAQMRWKTSIPRTRATRPFGATYEATPLVTMAVGLTKRPDQTVVALQSVVQFLDVWKTTRGPRTRPATS